MHRRMLLGAGHPGELRFSPLRYAGEARPVVRRPEEETITNAVQRTQPARNQGADAPFRVAEFGLDRDLSRDRWLSGTPEGRQDDARADHRRSESVESAR